MTANTHTTRRAHMIDLSRATLPCVVVPEHMSSRIIARPHMAARHAQLAVESRKISAVSELIESLLTWSLPAVGIGFVLSLVYVFFAL